MLWRAKLRMNVSLWFIRPPDPIWGLTFPRGPGDEVTIAQCGDHTPDVPTSPCCHRGHYNSPDVDPSSLLTVELFPSHLPHSATGPRRLYCVVGAVVIAVAVVRYKSQHRHFTPGAPRYVFTRSTQPSVMWPQPHCSDATCHYHKKANNCSDSKY